MKCPSCGREINVNSVKCVYCGVNIEMSNLNKKNFKKESKNKKIIILMELMIIIILIILYLILYSKRLGESIDYAHQIRVIKTCEENYEGKWNRIKQICETEVGNIKIK